MRTLREFFNPGKTVSTLGALKFGTSVFRDQTRYPHWEMDQAMRAYENRPQVNSGINQLTTFIIGNEITAASEDDRSQKFLATWIKQRANIRQEINNFVTTTIITGNGYLEPTYRDMNNGRKIVDNFFSLNDPSRVYYNLDTRKTDNEFWLYEVPIEIKVYPYAGEEVRPKFWRVNYVRGSILFQKMVYAIPIHTSKIWHLKLGWSRDGIYGRSFLASVIDDTDIFSEIMKNLGIISRSRALNLKLLTLGSEEDKATPDDINALKEQFTTRIEDEHLILNKPIKEINLSHQGSYDKMGDTIDFFVKDINSGLLPQFLTPWSNEVNRATAAEAKLPFQLRLTNLREEIIRFFNDQVIGSLRQEYTWLAEDASFQFEQLDLSTMDEKMGYAHQLFSNNAITLNEYRIMAGFERVVGGDKWAYQLSALPVDQYTQRTSEKGQIGQGPEPPAAAGTPGQPVSPGPGEQPQAGTAPGGMPEPPGASPTKTNERLGPIAFSGSFTEKATKEKDVDDMSDDEVFTELYDTKKSVRKLIKAGVTGKIVTLHKKDKTEVHDIVEEAIDDPDMTGTDFRKKIREALVQKTKAGTLKYKNYNVERIARTELASVRTLRNLLEWRELGYTKVKHITHPSKESAPRDKKLNGKVLEIEHLLKNSNDRVPLHPNCRCSYTPIA